MTKRRRFWIGAAIMVVALPLVVREGWRRSDPGDPYVALANHDALHDLYRVALSASRWRARIGYTAEQATEDAARQKRVDDAEASFIERLRLKRGRERLTLAQIQSLRDAEYPNAVGRVRDAVGPIPRLRPDQESPLRRSAFERLGPWLLIDEGIAKDVGIGERQRQRIIRAERDIQALVAEDSYERSIWSSRMTGAPASVEKALRELKRQVRTNTFGDLYWAMTDAERKASVAQSTVLSRLTGYSPTRSLPGWVTEWRYRDHAREIWRARRRHEAEILASLTPDQRARWQTLVR